MVRKRLAWVMTMALMLASVPMTSYAAGSPGTVVKLGRETFSGCYGFKGSLKLSAGLTEISDFVFSGCRYIMGVLKLPDGLTAIGKSAFKGCRFWQ